MISEVGFDNFVDIPLPHEKALLKHFLKNEPLIIFDIGSCEGEDTVRYSKLFPKSKIFAFEPVPNNYHIASKNIKNYNLEDRVKLIQVALSDTNGEAEFYLSSGAPSDIEVQPDWDYGNKSSSLLAPEKTLEVVPWLKFNETTKVTTSRLDSFMKKNSINQIDIVHMDVQGAELMVLKGAGNLIKNINIIWLEVEAIELYKNQPLKNDIEAFMHNAGFSKALDTVNEVAGDQLYVNQRFSPKVLTKIKNSIRKLKGN